MEKSAWVTGVLNYFTWGLGYLYSGQKTSYDLYPLPKCTRKEVELHVQSIDIQV